MGGEIKKAYSTSLLSLASGKRILNGSPLAFGEGNVKGRIKNVLNYKKPASWIITAVVIAVIAVGIGLISNPHSNAPSMEWAKSLSVENVQNIELIVQTSLEHERYKKYEPGEFTEIVELINQSRGKLVKNPEDNNGSAQTFYITTKDGIAHRFSNIGNTYLKIDGDAYEAGYDWLSMWNFHGNSTVPAEFREKVVAGSSTAKTGGGGQGLTPYASQQTSLEPIAPRWSPEQSIDIVGMAELDYASDDIVIFHGYFGLFVYDLDSLQIIRSLDLKPLKCAAIQGDDYCDVTVSTDGNTVQLHRMSSENMYVYTVLDNTLRETAYERMNDRFGSNFIPIGDVIDSKKLGNYSYNAVKFETGEYGYLHTSDWTLGTLAYVRDDMMYKLFDIKEN